MLDQSTYQITASANPANGGIVSGDGFYAGGSTVGLTATANTDYQFVNWTENGNEVSTDATYNFTVNADRTLVANFSQTTSIEQVASADILIYPNPMTDVMNIKTDVNIGIVRIYNQLGKLVLEIYYQSQIDVSFYNKGMYLVKLYGKDNKLLSIKKVIIYK